MSNSSNKAFITVIIPVKNDPVNLTKAVKALRNEQQRHNLIDRIIVVDNLSSDNSFEVARSLPCQSLQTSGNVGEVRNVGARLANTTYLAFIDADVVISTDWSLKIKERLYDQEAKTFKQGILTGSIYDIPENANWLERTWFSSLKSRDKHTYINGGNMIIDREFFLAIGGFDEKLLSGEDMELCQRATMEGCLLTYDPTIHAIHLGYPKTISHFFKREVWHGQEMIKDWKNPFNNKALLFALFHLTMVLLLLYGLIFSNTQSLLVLALYPFILALLSSLRLEKKTPIELIQLSFLFSVYGIARMYSLLTSISLTKH